VVAVSVRLLDRLFQFQVQRQVFVGVETAAFAAAATRMFVLMLPDEAGNARQTGMKDATVQRKTGKGTGVQTAAIYQTL
jgi:hypothetical protein